MFRLIKLGMYALVGYALYELYQGFSTGEFQQRFGSQGGAGGGSQGGAGGGSQDMNRSFGGGGEQGRSQTLTGSGQGMREETQDIDGGSTPHQVGRGVTM